jgi:hypothetical protein
MQTVESVHEPLDVLPQSYSAIPNVRWNCWASLVTIREHILDDIALEVYGLAGKFMVEMERFVVLTQDVERMCRVGHVGNKLKENTVLEVARVLPSLFPPMPNRPTIALLFETMATHFGQCPQRLCKQLIMHQVDTLEPHAL